MLSRLTQPCPVSSTPPDRGRSKRPRRICPIKRGQRITRGMATPVAAQSGCWIPTSSRAWLDSAVQILEHRNYRADAHQARMKLLKTLYERVDPDSMAIHTSWGWLQAETGKCRSWVADTLAWAREQGLLVTFENGSTQAYRPTEYTLLHPDEGDRVPVYILTLPAEPTPETKIPTEPVDETWTPKLLAKEVYKSTRTREAQPQPFGPGKAAKTNTGRDQVGFRRARKTKLGREIIGSSLILRRLTPQHVAAISKPFLDAGWTPRDITYALDHTPEGQLHWQTNLVHSPAGWAHHRLRYWTNINGQPLPSRSQRAAAAAAAQARETAAKRTEERARQEMITAQRNDPAIMARIQGWQTQARQAIRQARWKQPASQTTPVQQDPWHADSLIPRSPQ